MLIRILERPAIPSAALKINFKIMKKQLFLSLIMLSLAFAGFSQTIPPPFINYQAVLYDLNGANPNNPLINQSFTTFVNINDELGNLLYREEHYASTDANGLITVKMGDGLYTAGPITNFNQIDWGVGKYYLVVDFVINGTTSSTAPEQLVTVPYSFYAGKAGNGMTAVADNGNGTLTFTYANGATYTTPTLSGIQGPAGPVGPVGPSGASGTAGQSAYDLWLGQGNTGTVQDFLSTSAYQIWLAQGNTGTAQDFLNTLVGPSGPQGIQGIPGTNGTNGATGPQGPQGLQGIQGVAGVNGVNGTNGRSAYEIAVLNGFVGTETQWLLSLVGATGPSGASGTAGPQGIQGPAGNDGATGSQGPIGLTGPQGPQGIQGPVGNDGATGSQGPIGLTGPQGIQGTAGVNGINGLNALIKTTTESAGVNCTNGGTKIETGLDTNGNGILDTVEINAAQTKYVCNGEQLNNYLISLYSVNSIFCSEGPTEVIEVTNPATGKIWMDRNLGASQVAISVSDGNAFGDFYQWGRGNDGHQCPNSPVTIALSNVSKPHGYFILNTTTPADWISPQNINLWQGISGTNNPCPTNFRLPTESEMNNERLSWSSQNSFGAFASPLKWTIAGSRNPGNGGLVYTGTEGYYWSSTTQSTVSRHLQIHPSFSQFSTTARTYGHSVRCIKN
jgi:hypothetical protein